MDVLSNDRRDTGDAPAPACSGDDAQRRAIARALWTEIHWLMPRDRSVTITVDGDDIDVAFGAPGAAGEPTPH